MLSQLAPPDRLDLKNLSLSPGPPSPTLSTASFISSVSWMADKTTSELIPLLKNAYSALKDKEKDLVLAAELGKSLLEHNMKLKSSYDSLLKLGTPPITPSTSTNTDQGSEDDMRFIPSRTTRDAMIEVLERKNTELTSKLEDAITEQESMSRSNTRKTRQLESEISLLKSNLDIASAKIQELQDMNQRQRKLENVHPKKSETDDLVDELYIEIDKTQKERDAALQSKNDLETKLAATLKDLSDLKKQFEKFEFTQQDFNQLQEAYDRQFNHINELNQSLEEHRSILQKLKEKGINIYSTRSSPAPSTYGGLEEGFRKNTLLQELESEWLKTKSSVSNQVQSAPSLISSCMYQMRDLQNFKEKSLQAFYRAPSVGFESVLSKATGIDKDLLDDAIDFIHKIEQEHNREKCMVLYNSFMDMEEFDVDDVHYPISDLYPSPSAPTKDAYLELQPYVALQPNSFIGRLKTQIRKIFNFIWKWCRFAIVLTAALLINAWRGPDSLLLTY